jgi:cytochrome oxidase assembly protein ShyY1
MVRLALTPRWLGAALVVLLVVVASVLLGRWQWDRTQTILAAERAATSQPIPVEEALVGADTEIPAEATGRPVTAAGDYQPSMQVAVGNREHVGASGVWIVTGLRLPSGRIVAVLRGSLPANDSPGALPPTGPVTVSGVLQPDEAFYADAAIVDGTVAAIAHDRLAAVWGVDVLPGFIVLTDQEPKGSPVPTPVPPTVQTADVAFPLQNFVYAFQWWLFGVFALGVYGRWLWLESRSEEDVAA